MIRLTIGNGSIEKSYPKLMKAIKDDCIVLFSAPKIGIVIRTDGTNPVGYYSKEWSVNCFEDFNEPITIQND